MTARERTERELVLAAGAAPLRMSWGAVFGGVVAALGVAILLYALGLALGLNVINPEKPQSLRSSGIFTSIWALITSFVALFVGGLVAGRGAGVLTRATGAIHGLVMWALTTLAAVWLVFSLLGTVVSSVASVGKTAVEAGAGAIAGGAGGAREMAKNMGVSAEDALKPVNDRLRAQGKPQITPEQFQAATKDVLSKAATTGSIDRETLVNSIAARTALSRADAEQVATNVEQQWQSTSGKLTDKLSSAARSVQTGTLKAAETTGKVFWGVFAALLLGLISAVLGATSGVNKRQRLFLDRPPEGPGYYPERRLRTNP